MKEERLSQNLKRKIEWVFWILSFIALGSLVAEYGFHLSKTTRSLLERLDLIILSSFLVLYLIVFLLSDGKRSFLRKHWLESLIAVLIMGELGLVIKFMGMNFFSLNTSARVLLVSSQILILLSIFSRSIRENHRLAKLRFHPSQVVLLSFVFLIGFGTLLLLLPKATNAGSDISFLDALFTATSASCVTGLAVMDTGRDFSRTGQFILLFLFQVGGLGIMTLSSFLALFFGRGVGLRERVFLMDVVDSNGVGRITKTLKMVIFLTFSIELVGAGLLFLSWADKGWSLKQRAFESVFHSVSAFCNAGFATLPNSMFTESENPWALLSIILMIICGGLGFAVIAECGRNLVYHKLIKRKFYRWSLQTKMVLLTTSILFLAGAVLLFFDPAFEQAPGNRGLQALFTSVTTRTAGFNTVDFAAFSLPGTLIIIMLMFVGASPGSTGGGVKVTTVAVFWASLRSTLLGKERVEMFKKTLPVAVVSRALVVFFFSILIAMLGTIALAISEPQANLTDIIFEAVSASATVGISRGLTGDLSSVGKVIVILLMFTGRLGPLTLALAVSERKRMARIEYPEESIMVG